MGTGTRSGWGSPAFRGSGTPTSLQLHVRSHSETLRLGWKPRAGAVGVGASLLAALTAADFSCHCKSSTCVFRKNIGKLGHRDSQEPPSPGQCGVPSGMGRMALQGWQWLWSPTPWQAEYKTFCPPFPTNPPQTTGILTAQLFQQPQLNGKTGRLGSAGMLFPRLLPGTCRK